eukprot:jgi/Chlat1/6207/Chrsp44S05745
MASMDPTAAAADGSVLAAAVDVTPPTSAAAEPRGDGDADADDTFSDPHSDDETDLVTAAAAAALKEAEAAATCTAPDSRDSGARGSFDTPALRHDALEYKIAELEKLAAASQEKHDEELAGLAKMRKRQAKELKQLMDDNTSSTEDKLKMLHSRFLQQATEISKLEKELLALRRKCELINKEKDTIYAECTKTAAVKTKLESLCRELQRQNKIISEESKRAAAEEQQKRQELSTKFHNTIKEITLKLEEQGDERMRQFKENEMLREKLKHFAEQYEIREQHFAHQLRTKDLEQQLLEAKLKQQMELNAHAELASRAYVEQNHALARTEGELRGQLAMYGNKFEQFQDTLTKSNEVFATFKKEMEKARPLIMSKTIKKLEKENAALKKKSEKSDITLIELLDERNTLKKTLETTKSQKDKLESLCRSLQTERKQQSGVVNSNHSATPAPPANSTAAPQRQEVPASMPPS